MSVDLTAAVTDTFDRNHCYAEFEIEAQQLEGFEVGQTIHYGAHEPAVIFAFARHGETEYAYLYWQAEGGPRADGRSLRWPLAWLAVAVIVEEHWVQGTLFDLEPTDSEARS